MVLARYHQVNKLSGLILVYVTFALPFCVWTLRGFIIGIPKELEEAAMVDGASRLGAFVRILLPLDRTGAGRDLGVRVHHQLERVHLRQHAPEQRHHQTITVWLSDFYGGSRAIDWGAVMAASTLISIPVVIFFLFVQRRIAFGLTAGAVRG